MWRAEDCAIREWLDRGELPGTPERLRAMAPRGGLAPPKVFDNRLIDADVFEVMPNPGAGYGDPMLRDPELVAADVRDGRLDALDAERIYGVELDGTGAPAENHEERRRTRLAERLGEAAPPLEPAVGTLGEPRGRALMTVAFGDDGDGRHVLGCAACGQVLAAQTGNYRLGASRLEIAPVELGAHFTDPFEQVGHRLVWRSYLCPACGVALDGELCRPEDAPLWDVRLEAR